MEAIEKYLLKIANVISLYSFDMKSNGLLRGRLGAAVFLFKYANNSKEPYFFEVQKDLLEIIKKDIKKCLINGFQSGLCGIGWGIEHLLLSGDYELEGVSDECESILINKVLDETVLLKDSEELYGYGLYFLKKRNSLIKKNNQYKLETINGILDVIIEDCIRILTKKKILGIRIPFLSLYQVNSIIYFAMEIIVYNEKKAIKIIQLCVDYVKKNNAIHHDQVDVDVFRVFTEKVKVSNADFDISIFSRESTLLDAKSLLVKQSLMNFIYYPDTICIDVCSVNSVIEDDHSWFETVDNLSEERLCLEGGLAGFGLLLLENMDLS